MIQKPRGTRDFLPDEMEIRRKSENCIRRTADTWGYREVCTPTFEHQELFTLRSGEGIIKEMYAFEDKGGRKIALRPEVTAPVLRMYVNEAKVMPKPLRWCYFSDCYRYERPQKGRYRQFWQFGAELIGADTAEADAEVILLADDILKTVGVRFELQVGHLSPMRHILRELKPDTRMKVMGLLDKRDMEGAAHSLAEYGHEDLQEKLEGLVACSDPHEAIEICGDIPEKNRIIDITGILDGQECKYRLNFGIVRGLDYYTGMVFEGFAENLGAENQIVGGGAYRLAHLFGGDDVGSCGFAIGFDRVMVALGECTPENKPVVAIVYTPAVRDYAFSIAHSFRKASIRTEINLLERGIGAQMKHASKTASHVSVIGEREKEAGVITLRNLSSGEQRECSIEEAIEEVCAGGNS